MKSISLLIFTFAITLLTSCHKHYDVTETIIIENNYHFTIRNTTKGELLVNCPAKSYFTLLSGDETDVISYSEAEMTIDFFGEGTYYSKQDAKFTLKEYETVRLDLEYGVNIFDE